SLSVPLCFVLSVPLRPPLITLFPYTTLFRSLSKRRLAQSSVSRLDVVVSKLGEIMKSTHDELDPVPLPYVSGLNGTNASQQTHRSEEHTSELQSRFDLVCRLLLEKKKEST